MFQAPVRDAMGQVDVEVPGLSRTKLNMDAAEEEFNVRIGLHGNVKAKFAIFKAQGMVSVFLNHGFRRQAE